MFVGATSCNSYPVRVNWRVMQEDLLPSRLLGCGVSVPMIHQWLGVSQCTPNTWEASSSHKG